MKMMTGKNKVIIYEDGSKIYYDGNYDFHREDGPASINSDGTYSHYIRNKRHGMSFFVDDGAYIKYVNDVMHQDNGAAEQSPNGLKIWWRHGYTIWPDLA